MRTSPDGFTRFIGRFMAHRQTDPADRQTVTAIVCAALASAVIVAAIIIASYGIG